MGHTIARMVLPRYKWDEAVGEKGHLLINQEFELLPKWKVKITELKVEDDFVHIRFFLPQWLFPLFMMFVENGAFIE